MLIVDPLYVNCRSTLHQPWIPPGSTVLIASMSTVDPLCQPWIHPHPQGSTVLIASMSTVDLLYINHRSAHPSPRSTGLIASTLTGDPLYINSRSSTSTADLPTPRINSVDHLYVNCRSSLCQLWICPHPRINSVDCLYIDC